MGAALAASLASAAAVLAGTLVTAVTAEIQDCQRAVAAVVAAAALEAIISVVVACIRPLPGPGVVLVCWGKVQMAQPGRVTVAYLMPLVEPVALVQVALGPRMVEAVGLALAVH
jgi:hypothetical protein